MAAVVDVVDQCGWVGEEGRGPIGVGLAGPYIAARETWPFGMLG